MRKQKALQSKKRVEFPAKKLHSLREKSKSPFLSVLFQMYLEATRIFILHLCERNASLKEIHHLNKGRFA